MIDITFIKKPSILFEVEYKDYTSLNLTYVSMLSTKQIYHLGEGGGNGSCFSLWFSSISLSFHLFVAQLLRKSISTSSFQKIDR